MGKASDRLNRILLMVPIVLKDEGIAIADLSKELGASEDEILEDLDILFMCGLPDYTPGYLIDRRVEGGRVYVDMADYFKRPLTLTKEEALALLVAGRALLKARVFKKRGPLGSALKKVEGTLSEDELGEVEEVVERIDVELDRFSGKIWNTIDASLQKGKNLAIEYYSFSRDEVSSREVEPWSLVSSKGHWYLLAWCHQVKDKRLFRLDRIKSAKLVGRTPSRKRERDLYVPELVGEYRPGRKSHDVRLRFSGREGRRLVEDWPIAKFKENKDGTLTVELKTRNLTWLSTYLLRFGDRFRVESPRELTEMVEEKAKELLEVYG